MYFNETSDTNIDDELKGSKVKKKKEKRSTGEKKDIKFRITPDTLLMFFYGFLLIIGIFLIVISLK